ncbi:centromere-associated protein E isoform X2 [Iris pallida]|uniref:Centromere-associated protein E isoform X2 n=1 Tax=Iris pallida TaxID=29817 RepID=A0AAX6FTX3_IRIPA|nr:centromere-associated protein E isoform X2 [Iris pallida]
MQALDEEESQMEALENRNMELENVMQGKMVELENLEAFRAKTLAKLSTTVSKFDELHNLSESLLAEIESLQSQLQERDSEISFLRQEVTRCTNDVLASQETSKNYSSEMHELLSLMEKMATRFGGSHVQTSDQNQSSVRSYIDIIDKKFVDAMDELDDLRVTVQSKDSLLQIEKGKVEELLSKMEELETLRDSGPSSSMNSPRTVETEQMVQRNKVSSGPIAAHIRSARKVNNDQIAIAIDVEKDDNTLDDEDDDKAHGFKSLTMSRLIPRATRPISDMIDGIWVSAERLLMRQPSLRLGVIIYWVVLHALLASFI